MNAHDAIQLSLPEYAAGTLPADDNARVEEHLQTCTECQQDLLLWRSISIAICETSKEQRANKGLLTASLLKIRAKEHAQPIRLFWLILRSQLSIVQRELWPASLVVILIGYVAAVLLQREIVFQAVAPLITATSIALMYGSENDPASEIAHTTPSSPATLLLARLAIVFFFNFSLACAASVFVAVSFPDISLGELILSWLAPMCLLSSLGLLLSIMTRSEVALVTTYSLWLARFFLPVLLPWMKEGAGNSIMQLVEIYTRFWSSAEWLMGISLALLVITLIWVNKKEYKTRFALS